MDGESTLAYLRELATSKNVKNRGAQLKRALIICAIPMTAGMAVACYGAPSEELPYEETNCSDGVDEDEDGDTDCEDEDCFGTAECT